jgi:hypothetical protein
MEQDLGQKAASDTAAATDAPQPLPHALETARKLHEVMPSAQKKQHGDREGAVWWENHEGLFEDARKEWGPKCGEVYRLAPSLSDAAQDSVKALACAPWLQDGVKQALATGTPTALRSILREVCKDRMGLAVYQLDLFTEDFCNVLLSELDHLEASGIPLRRPNGMNRFGAILSHLGFQEGLLEPLMKYVVKPLSRELWPQWVDTEDLDETYGFVVRYRIGEDVDLAEHADTSNVTLNACLGREFAGGELYFKGVRFTDSGDDTETHDVSHKRGSAVLHLGGHFHGVYPITSGERSNLVLWGTGEGGYVRIRPATPRKGPF